MALKAITVRLDEEEYEKLKEILSEFGDPDINVAYVLRCYIRDLNRTLPFMVKSGWDLKNYFGLFGSWLKQFGSMADADLLSKMVVNPWAMWNAPGSAGHQGQGRPGEESPGGRKKEGAHGREG